jgi:uncharacterized protein
MTDELNRPLGRRPPERRPPGLRTEALLYGGVSALLLLGGAALFLSAKTPLSGEPYAIARIEPEKAKEPEPAAAAPMENVVVRAEAPAAPVVRSGANGERVASGTEVEEMSGVKVTRNGGGGADGPLIIQIAPTSGVRLAPAPDRRVSEKGRYGLLPKMAADGARPMDIYSRPFVTTPKLKNGAPRLALIIGGVGLNASASALAIDETPEDVTLAFAPYGGNLDALVGKARARGHEALLQAPMEPFDYPQNDPGPHTLKTSVAAETTRDDLHWLMSRFSGYAGVMNFLGARFLSDETALAGALGEIGGRGLFFLDDGTAPQSLAGAVAPHYGAPFGRVDVTIDAHATPQAMDSAFARLEALARQKGAAIGFIPATPEAITRAARFARDLERRGIALAPVSAVLAPAAGASAEAGAKAAR